MNKFKKFFLGIALLTIGLYSCSNDNENLVADSPSQQVLSNRITSDSLMYSFATEVKKSSLESNLVLWKELIDQRKFENLNVYTVKIDSIVNKLNIKYGKENVSVFLTKLNAEDKMILGEHDGSPCTRNHNGSIYLGACSFWGKLKFYLSLSCSGMPTNNPKQIEELFDCYQEDICSICG